MKELLEAARNEEWWFKKRVDKVGKGELYELGTRSNFNRLTILELG